MIAPRLSAERAITSGYLVNPDARPPRLPPRWARDSDGWAADLRIRTSKVTPMATFSVDFLGCKVSHTDAQAVRERLLVDGPQKAGRRRRAEHVLRHPRGAPQVRHAASQAARTHRRVYVTGCGANLSADAFVGLPENVVVIARPSEETPAAIAGDVGAIGCVQADARLDRVRAFVKVQDGCSFSCNFCVIPFVRGASRSRCADAVLTEIRRRVDHGHREVVLTGINLGCYRDRDAGYDLPRLIREAGATPGLARLRLSSIEVNHVNGAACRLRAATVSGACTSAPVRRRVLRAMARRYDSAPGYTGSASPATSA